MDTEFLRTIAMYADLSKSEMRMLILIIGLCELTKTTLISLDEMSAALATSKPNASSILSSLVRKGIVIREDTSNRGLGSKSYKLRLNTDVSMYSFPCCDSRLDYRNMIESKDKEIVHLRSVINQMKRNKPTKKLWPWSK